METSSARLSKAEPATSSNIEKNLAAKDILGILCVFILASSEKFKALLAMVGAIS